MTLDRFFYLDLELEIYREIAHQNSDENEISQNINYSRYTTA